MIVFWFTQSYIRPVGRSALAAIADCYWWMISRYVTLDKKMTYGVKIKPFVPPMLGISGEITNAGIRYRFHGIHNFSNACRCSFVDGSAPIQIIYLLHFLSTQSEFTNGSSYLFFYFVGINVPKPLKYGNRKI